MINENRCILSCSYIKPQLLSVKPLYWYGCILSCSYIKPQLLSQLLIQINSCILSCSYIKPQREPCRLTPTVVVYYHVPTSNHNYQLEIKSFEVLYIIMFLHQTTTAISAGSSLLGCILSCSYIKPQHTLG